MKHVRPLSRIVVTGCLALSIGQGLAACDMREGHEMETMTATELTNITDPREQGTIDDPAAALLDERSKNAVFEFGAELLGRCIDAEAADSEPAPSVLVSPLSVLNALALVQNGARGETLAQLEATTGLDAQTLNGYLNAYRARIAGENLFGGDEPGEPLDVQLANSIWIKDSKELEIDDAYLDTCSRMLGASAFRAPFDESTEDDINGWVDRHTDEMIPAIIDSIPDDARLYLINALSFDSAWAYPYEPDNVHDAVFTCEDGTVQDISLMASLEDSYLQNDMFTGFVRPYAEYRFGFVGLLPREGATLAEAVESLDGATLCSLLQPVPGTSVEVLLPRFTHEYQGDLARTIETMGARDLFDPQRADLGGIGRDGQGPLYASGIKHKTYINVSEQGTRAAAATSIGMFVGSAPPALEFKLERVVLDRPFIYMIVDLETQTPLFLGTVASVE